MLESGSVVIYPRTFAVGTKQRAWVSCTAESQGYLEALEPIPEGWIPNEYDSQRAAARGVTYRHLLRPHSEGEVFFKVRGKEIFVAAGYVSGIHCMVLSFTLTIRTCAARCAHQCGLRGVLHVHEPCRL